MVSPDGDHPHPHPHPHQLGAGGEDNAIAIALAARNLPGHLKQKAIIVIDAPMGVDNILGVVIADVLLADWLTTRQANKNRAGNDAAA